MVNLFENSKPPCKVTNLALLRLAEVPEPEKHARPDPEWPDDCTVGWGSTFCAAGDLLDQKQLFGERPWPGPNPGEFYRRCKSWRPWHAGGGGSTRPLLALPVNSPAAASQPRSESR